MASKNKQIRLTLMKSRFHRKPGHAECLFGLGLRKRHQTIVVADTPENRGMISRVHYLLAVEEI